ncbi:MAG: SPFH domain-containing protein [Bryobacterales bacterium]|nr:SPFH domain-containing protein [Bryobacterales bacterium]
MGVLLLLAIAFALFEFRLRKPDQLVLRESRGEIRLRSGVFYPRHFSLAIPAATHPIELDVESACRGAIPVRVRLAVTVAASRANLAGLVRAGGWQSDAIAKAAQAFETVIQGAVAAYAEPRPVEELSGEGLAAHLEERLGREAARFGLEIVALSVRTIEPADPAIAEALRQRESARILEQTEQLQQQARVSAARARVEAEEQIALAEHQLELKKLELKRQELEREAALAEKRTEDELKRSRMRLAFEREELALLKSNPELLLLTPQAARLAEASQTLKNARTIVSIGSSDAELGSALSRLFQRFLDLMESGKKQIAEHGDAD